MSQENVEVVRRGFETINREGLAGVFKVIDEVADPEVELRAVGRLPDVGNVVRGPDAVKAWFAGLFGTFEVDFEADEFVDAGDAVVVVFRQFVRGRGSGTELSDSFGFVYGFREGKIMYVDGYRTREQALKALRLEE